MANMLGKEKIIRILGEWNFWDKQLPNITNRPLYTTRFDSLRKDNKPIVVVGMRRVGKTYCLFSEMSQLKVDNKQILYVNLEDNRFEGYLTSQLLDEILETYRYYINSDNGIYLFLDEIQNVENWAKWVRTNLDLGKVKKMYITGSSAKLLSGEIATSLGGRYRKLEINPLTFKEYLLFKGVPSIVKSLGKGGQKPLSAFEFNNIVDFDKNRLAYLKYFEAYLGVGGFPEVLSVDLEMSRKQIIDSYFDTIVYKDIVARYNLKDSSKIKLIIKHLLTNDTKKSNVNAIAIATGLSYNTVEEYLSFLKEIYFIYELYEYNYSLKRQYNKDIKYYCSEISFVNNYSFNFSENKGRLLENVVFNWLLRNKGSDNLYYYNNGTNECDFVVLNKNKPSELIQVTWKLNNDSKEREVEELLSAMDKFNLDSGTIITFDCEDTFKRDGKVVRVVPAWKWMLTKE